MARLGRKARLLGLRRLEVEGARTALAAYVLIVSTILEAGLEAVLAADDGHVVLQDPGAVVTEAAGFRTQAATGTDAATQNGLAAKGERGERGGRGILEANLRRPILVDEDGLIDVAEAVVTYGKAVLDGGRNAPVLTEAANESRRLLQLEDIGGRAGRSFPTAARRVVAHAVIVVERNRHAVLGIEDVVAFGGVHLLVENRAASTQRNHVVEQVAVDRVSNGCQL